MGVEMLASLLKQFKGARVKVIIGLACLWPCLQASGFYPVSLLSSVSVMDVQTVALYHLLYSVVLLILFFLCTLLYRKLARGFIARKIPLILFGILGSVGSLLLCLGDSSNRVAMSIGIALVAFFIATAVLSWGFRASQTTPKLALFEAASGFLLAELIIAIYYSVGFSNVLLLVACPLISGVCGMMNSAKASNDSVTGSSQSETSACAALGCVPWKIVAPSLFLVYFCIIFVRLLIGSDTLSDSTLNAKALAALICFVTFAIVLFVLQVNMTDNKKLTMIFALLSMVYMVSLAFMLLFESSNSVMIRRIMIASEHCVEVFLWMTLAFVACRERRSSVLLFSLYGIVVIALPWMISFDWYYLSGAYLSVLSENIFVPAITGAFLFIAISVVVFLTSQIVSPRKGSESLQNATAQEQVAVLLDSYGLTHREAEVATLVYRGLSAKIIAEKLYLSEPTVKVYTSRVYRKIDVHSKQEFIQRVDELRNQESADVGCL